MNRAKPSLDEARRELEDLLARPASDFKSWHLPEPHVVVGNGSHAPDPKTGIRLYGPCGTRDDQPLTRIRLAIIGTGETIQDAQNWLTKCRSAVGAAESDADPYLFPPFPGMAASDGFGCSLEFPLHLVETLAPGDIARCTAAPTRDAAVEAIACVVRERLDALHDRDTPPDVVLVALPMEVRAKAGDGRRPPRRRKAKEAPRQLQLSFLDEPRPERASDSRTLHRAIKAEGMRFGLPTQLAWPTTFSSGEGRQDDATRAWNFCTALYYKAGGVPWRVTGLAKNTCYVGISFYRPIGVSGELQTSMAQAFSDRGDGVVLRGSSFPWDSRRQGPPHLTREAALSLLGGVIEQYVKHHRQMPTRVVVHKSSWFSEEELAGMESALDGKVPYYDFLSVARSDIRFLRVGAEPPIRGTVIQVAPRRYVVYTRGYVPFLKLYPGLRIPHPLQVAHPKGSGSVTELLAEFLALTRMNWNSADFAAAEPITLGFARKIGLILSELPLDVTPATSFRFYM